MVDSWGGEEIKGEDGGGDGIVGLELFNEFRFWIGVFWGILEYFWSILDCLGLGFLIDGNWIDFWN